MKRLIATMIIVLVAIIGFLYNQNRYLRAAINQSQLQAPLAPMPTPREAVKQPEYVIQPESVASGPRVVANPRELDLGEVSKSQGKVTANFTISNSGSQTLIIHYAFASCGCTTADLKNISVEPGNSIQFPVEYNPNYFSYELGPIQKSITLITNDPKNSLYRLALKATVNP